jgi:hypothetical protein
MKFNSGFIGLTDSSILHVWGPAWPTGPLHCKGELMPLFWTNVSLAYDFALHQCNLKNNEKYDKMEVHKLDVHTSVHRDTTMKITNKLHYIDKFVIPSRSLHVSGDVFAHHQEHLTVFTVSGSIQPSCCRLVSWMSWNWSMWIVRRVCTSE